MKNNTSCALDQFERALTPGERKLVASLRTPLDVQRFLDGLTYSSDDFYRCPLRVLRDGVAHCFDGAVFAAAMFQRLGIKPALIDMIPNDRDDDHVLAVFGTRGGLGSVAKSNFVGLRYREPIHRDLRELVVSYFEQYYNVAGEKTLRAYTALVRLAPLSSAPWMSEDPSMETVAARLDSARRITLITPEMAGALAPVDPRSLDAGLSGSNPAGLFRPPSA